LVDHPTKLHWWDESSTNQVSGGFLVPASFGALDR
jgi:hypothetical protein